MTTYINLFGGPGSGKSTTAAHLFALMKLKGMSVEYVPEWCKLLNYEDRPLPPQYQIFHGQYDWLKKPQGKMDYVVTDSPILLSAAYGTAAHDAYYAHQDFSPCKNFWIDRWGPYSPVGRQQTYQEALAKDADIIRLFNKFVGDFHYSVASHEQAASIILARLND